MAAFSLTRRSDGTVVTILAHDYARQAVRHRAKGRPDQWAETIAEWRDRIARLPVRTPAGRRIAICPATRSSRGANRPLPWQWPEALKPRQCRVDQDAGA